MAELKLPYDLSHYAYAWSFPPASIDPRHLFWMFDVLCAGQFHHALEIGCLNGASSTAFIEAIHRDKLSHSTFCDIEPQGRLMQVLTGCRHPGRVSTYTGRSVDLLRTDGEQFDFVFVDGDHSLDTVREEVELLLQCRPVCVTAHDTSAQLAGFPDCDGPAYLKQRFQTTAPYMCLEENSVRIDELTQRGVFLATTSPKIFEQARESLKTWCGVEAPMPAPAPKADSCQRIS